MADTTYDSLTIPKMIQAKAVAAGIQMSDLSVTKPYQRRRRFSREFKAQIVAQCLEAGASISRIAQGNGFKANMVRRWIWGKAFQFMAGNIEVAGKAVEVIDVEHAATRWPEWLLYFLTIAPFSGHP